MVKRRLQSPDAVSWIFVFSLNVGTHFLVYGLNVLKEHISIKSAGFPWDKRFF